MENKRGQIKAKGEKGMQIIVEKGMLSGKTVKVREYLTYAEIQYITNEVCALDSWADREQTIDILLINYVTDLSKEDIENCGHKELLFCGLIDEVKRHVKNYERIYEAINYTQSTQRTMLQVMKELPKNLEQLKEVITYGKANKK